VEKNLKTRLAILDAARSLFAEQGVRKTTLEDIARRMHRTKSFVYHYFRGKDGLFSALIEAEGDAYARQLREAIDGEPGAKKRLRAYMLARFRIFNDLGGYYEAMRERYFEQYAFIENARAKYDRFETETMTRILAEGTRDGEFRSLDAEAVAHAILIAMKGFEVEWAASDGKGFERKLDDLLGVLFDGILRRKGKA
jgi:AcrR family transcriptional regulator